MLWFITPRFTQYIDGQLSEECPGAFDSTGTLVRFGGTPLRVLAYDRGANNQCLVGVSVPLSPPAGWQSLTVEQARAVFFQIKLREPTVAEVF